MKTLILALVLLSGCAQDPEAGPPGAPGTDGRDGNDGSSCSVSQVAEGALITCSDGSTALVTNGEPGQDGVTRTVVITPGKPKDVCGK